MPQSDPASVDGSIVQNAKLEQSETAGGSPPTQLIRQRLRFLAFALLCIMFAPFLFVLGMWLQYEYVSKPAALRTVGNIELGIMSTSASPDSIEPPGASSENAASHYVLALNSYNQRRAPYMARGGLSPFIQEPRISADNLRQLASGAKQRECFLYEEQGGRPRYVFYILPQNTKWPFRPGTDPFELRPYTGPVRALAQSSLNWGKERENAGQPGDAEWAFQNVSRFGYHLRSKPGAMLDIELGLEIETKALHYLETLYKETHNRRKEELCHQYAASVSDLQRRIRAKFTQLDNPEAAKEVLHQDSEPIWRITAAVALVSAEHFHDLDWIESWSARLAIRRAKRDPNRYVREACYHLSAMKPSDFRAPEVQTGPVE
jgi:hypothetical protein